MPQVKGMYRSGLGTPLATTGESPVIETLVTRCWHLRTLGTERYPAIAAAATKLRAKSFTLGGEAVVTGEEGVAVFDVLHRRHRAADAMLYAFDLLELDGEDLRSRPLRERKTRLAGLSARSPAGIAFNDHTDEDGATVFRHACKLGLESIVSKRLTAPYRSGPSRDWIKVKNPDSPATVRLTGGGVGSPARFRTILDPIREGVLAPIPTKGATRSSRNGPPLDTCGLAAIGSRHGGKYKQKQRI
jgi:bifunctional non-homologous end joining protein LigD